jgi:electron transport complex protein RnfE
VKALGLYKSFVNGIVDENPTFRLVLGICPTLAVTTAMENGFWMGIAVIFVLTMSNLIVSAIRKMVPDKIRIPIFVVVIASFVTIVEMVMKAYLPDMFKILGIFVPLIVVNCIIMARAEAFASKNPVPDSIADGLGMGVGFTLALVLIGAVREILGTGSLRFMGVTLLNNVLKDPAIVAILPPGALLTFGLILGVFNIITSKAHRGSQKEGATS